MCDILVANGKNTFTGNQKLQEAIKVFFKNKGAINNSGIGGGFGYMNGGARVYQLLKDPKAAKESDLTKAIIDSREYPFNSFFLHVREASQGQINFENTQPFEVGNTLFAHNGDVGKAIKEYPRLGEANEDSSDSVYLHAALRYRISKFPSEVFSPDENGLPMAYFNAMHSFFSEVNGIKLDDGSESRLICVYDDGKYLFAYQNKNPWKELRVQDISMLETVPLDAGWCTIQVPSVIIYTSHNDKSLKAMSESGDEKRMGYAGRIKQTAWNECLVDGPYGVIGDGNMQVFLGGKQIHTVYPQLSRAA